MSKMQQPVAPQRSARERLLSAADELFYTGGVTATGVDAVIERAGVATGSLYNNFGGKDALVEAYLRDRDERWQAQWEACIEEQSAPVERVLALFTAVDRWLQAGGGHRGCAHVAAALQLPADHPGTRAASDHKARLADRLRELCAETGADDAADLALDLLMIYEGMHTFIAMSLDAAPIARARSLAATRLSGVKGRR